MGVKIEVPLASKDGWGADFQTVVNLALAHPWACLGVFGCFLIVLILLPGGVGPAWVKYRGARGELKHRQQSGVNEVIDIVHTRSVPTSPQRTALPRPRNRRSGKKGGKRR